MGHDQHFLERLDRVPTHHVELALGLYRDHELVRAILLDARLPPDAERVALALDDGGSGPHIVVARNGAFVTCLGEGMSTGALPIVSRAHLDGLATKVERVREGLALAKKRGVDASVLLERIESVGSKISREDFVSATAVIGPAVPLLMGIYTSWATTTEALYPLLQSLSGRAREGERRSQAESALARGAWAMAHSATILVDTASREWVREWGRLEAHDKFSPWAVLTRISAFPFVVRAAWLAARLGKPMIASYKERFLTGANAVEVRESGWGLACMGLRHASLRAEAFRTLQSLPRRPEPQEAWVQPTYKFFAEISRVLEEKEEMLWTEAQDLGRGFIIIRTDKLPDSSRHRYVERAKVPDDLVLPGLFDAWYDAHNGERAADLMLLGVVAASRARAEDFYFPAQVLHAMGEEDLEGTGEMMVEMRRKFMGVPQTVRHGARPGRNDACPCGSGKKYKKCHGG